MRWAFVLVAVTGCGRIAFDPRSDANGDGSSGDGALACPAGYTADSGSCYRNGGSNLTWLAAEAACEADGVGAHLAVIADAAEAAVVTTYLTTPTDFAWIGATDVATEGVYRTVTNRTMSYLAWGMTEPEGALQDCIVLINNNQLADGLCGNADDFICEYDGMPAVSAVWGVCPNGYTFTGGGCYRFDNGGGGAAGDWFAAEADCEDDVPGSHLVIVDDVAEAMVVDTLVPGTILDHMIGATDLVTEGVFVDVLGRPITYTTFASGEPDGGTSFNCLRMSDAIELSDTDCNASDDYVCENDGLIAIPASWGQ